jgi:hypothetical protein
MEEQGEFVVIKTKQDGIKDIEADALASTYRADRFNWFSYVYLALDFYGQNSDTLNIGFMKLKLNLIQSLEKPL